MGVTVRQLRKYEKQESLIPIDKAYLLARMLNVKVDELYEVVYED
ncbi:helix-turn-helix domain-containing protein [Cytobacillus sp. FSL R5-0569]